ncbi:MAG: permease-like cell division protein FtsX [Firmicutes bacterium]|nr:permease-like cell division protein FtsX [Bacillota bacterium]
MRIGSIGYLLREGIRNFWSNRLMSFASVGVLISCMLLSGGSVLISLNVESIMAKVEQNNLVMVYLNDDVGVLEAVKVGDEISRIPNVAESTLVTKDEGLQELMEQVEDGDALLEQLAADNPLPNAYRVTLDDLEQYDVTVAQLQELDGVQKVRGESEVPKKIIQVEHSVNGVLIWIIALLIVVSMFIITNTIRVTMFNRRKEISIMKSVGATDWFIRVPFVAEGMIIGILSGALATLLLDYIYNNVSWGSEMFFSLVSFDRYRWLFAAAFVGAGIIFGAIGGVISIGRYLKSEGGDLYE